MENYLGGSSKALQFMIDVLAHAQDNKCSPDALFRPGGAEQIPTNIFYCIMLQSFVIETSELQNTNHDRRQKHRKFGDSNPAASCNIPLQRSLSELERSSAGGDIIMKGYP
jgi:hypothetical protein